jgi:hypothetical protein
VLTGRRPVECRWIGDLQSFLKGPTDPRALVRRCGWLGNSSAAVDLRVKGRGASKAWDLQLRGQAAAVCPLRISHAVIGDADLRAQVDDLEVGDLDGRE